SRAALLDRLKIDKPQMLDDGGMAIPPPRGATYDALLVWFENDRVTRVVARHTLPPAASRPAPSTSDQITQAWARSIRSLGWPTRQDAGPDAGLLSLGWHDDRTRVRIFAQDVADGSPRVFTEWKELGEKTEKQ
ncbi:MAG TPA: hypothetical protein VKE94_19905, partial [Gemmataceae bacterium]|nr:hypothetical protein [Gemmataceae bacterium]